MFSFYSIYGYDPITGYELVSVQLNECDMLIVLYNMLNNEPRYTKYTVVSKNDEETSVYGVYYKEDKKENDRSHYEKCIRDRNKGSF